MPNLLAQQLGYAGLDGARKSDNISGLEILSTLTDTIVFRMNQTNGLVIP